MQKITVLALVFMLVGVSLFVGVLAYRSLVEALSPTEYYLTDYRVSSGDRAWNIIKDLNGGHVDQELVYYFHETNGYGHIRPGQVVKVPVLDKGGER